MYLVPGQCAVQNASRPDPATPRGFRYLSLILIAIMRIILSLLILRIMIMTRKMRFISIMSTTYILTYKG